MQEYPKPEDKKLFFLFSLILHVLLLYILFLFLSYQKSSKSVLHQPRDPQKELNTSDSAKQPEETTNTSESKSQEIAQLKAQQSAFGAPVIFQDMPESIPTLAANETLDGDGHDVKHIESELSQKTEPQERIGQDSPRAQL